jgi:hypothetical protein
MTAFTLTDSQAAKSEPAAFVPPDPSILNASIPAFFIGRDRDGFWIVREVRGSTGGIFLLESSALAFARKYSRPSGCATIYCSESFELDVKNQGNPLISWLKSLLRIVRR